MREGWRLGPATDFAEVNPRVSGVTSVSPFVTMADVSEWGRWVTTKSARGSRGGIKASGGDTLVARITPCLENGKIAQVPGSWGNIGGSTEFIVLRAKPQLLPDFLFLWAQAPMTHTSAISKMIGTTGRQRVSATDLGTLPLALPPLDEQRRIVDLIAVLDEVVAGQEASLSSICSVMSRAASSLHERATVETWESTNLAEVLGGIDSIRTGPFGSQLHQSDYVADGPVAVVMPANMSDQRVDLAEAARISEANSARLSRHRTHSGDILWSRRGDVARFAVIDDVSDGSLCGTGCFLLRAKDPSMVGWLEPWLAAPESAAWLEAKSVGATMANLNRSILSKVPVALAPEQERISIAAAWNGLRSTRAAVRGALTRSLQVRKAIQSALLSGEHEIPASYDELIGV